MAVDSARNRDGVIGNCPPDRQKGHFVVLVRKRTAVKKLFSGQLLITYIRRPR